MQSLARASDANRSLASQAYLLFTMSIITAPDLSIADFILFLSEPITGLALTGEIVVEPDGIEPTTSSLQS